MREMVEVPKAYFDRLTRSDLMSDKVMTPMVLLNELMFQVKRATDTYDGLDALGDAYYELDVWLGGPTD